MKKKSKELALRLALKLARTGLVLGVVVMWLAILLSCFNPFGVGKALGTAPPDPREQQAIAQADAGQGKQLRQEGRNGAVVDPASPLRGWLDDRLREKGVMPTGNYVVYSKGAKTPKPDTTYDSIVDAATGQKVAITRDYTNGRGMTCFADEIVAQHVIEGNWQLIAAHLWNQSLDEGYTIQHDDLSAVPRGVMIRCFTQQS